MLSSKNPALLLAVTIATITIAIAVIGPLALLPMQDTTVNFITYRFAAHLATGRGLLFGTPNPAVTMFPLAPVLLVTTAANLPIGGVVLGVIARLACAVLLGRLTGNAENPPFVDSKGVLAGLCFVLASLLWPSLIILVMLAFAMASLDAACRGRWLLAGTLTGVAILAEPSAIPLVLLVLVLALRESRAAVRFALPTIVVSLVGLALTRFAAGTQNLTFALPVSETISLVLPILALLALSRNARVLRDRPYLAVLFAWSALLTVSAVLRGSWPSAAILPGVIALTVLLPWPGLALVGACADLILALILHVPTPPVQDFGAWIVAHSSPDDTLATADVGALAYLTDRPVIDLSGDIQPGAMTLQLDRTFILQYAPNLLVVPDNAVIAWDGFNTTYAHAFDSGGKTVYQRVVNFTPLIDHPVDIVYHANLNRADLRLVGVANADTLHPGDLMRVRLDWVLANPPSYDIDISVNLLDSQGKSLVGTGDKFSPGFWHTGPISTYHLVGLPKDIPAGPLTLHVSAKIREGDLGDHPVVPVNVEPR